MTPVTYREIWLALDALNPGREVNDLAGAIAYMAKGGETMFRIALFKRLPVDENDPGEFMDHSTISSFLLNIRSTSYSGTLLLDSSSGAELSRNNTASEVNFVKRADAPISILCPPTITAIAAGTQYLICFGTTNASGTNKVPFGKGQITVDDIGLTASDSAPPAGPNNVTSDIVNALFNQCVKYGTNPKGKTFTLVSPSEIHARVYGVDDNGNDMADLG